MLAVIGSFRISQVSSCHVQLFIEYFISYMKMKEKNAHLYNKFSPLDKCTIPTVEILKPCVHGVLIDASCSRNSFVQVRTVQIMNIFRKIGFSLNIPSFSADSKPPVRERMFLWWAAESGVHVSDAGDHDVS